MKAQALRRGDLISLIEPSSAPATVERIENAVLYFESLGYRVTVGKHVMEPRGYLAAPDPLRLRDLHDAFANKNVKAIFFIRGGYGSIRLLPEINYELIRRNPKILVGYSDATALFAGLRKQIGFSSAFLGPMPGVDIWNGFDEFAEDNFWRALTSVKPLGELPLKRGEAKILNKRTTSKSASGKLIGGNLPVFSSICGTPYQPLLKNAMLAFEDVDERPYRIDRYFAQLRAMGAFENASAILLGQFSDCDAEKGKPSLTLEEVFQDYFGKLKIPVITNLPFGHIQRQWTMPYGARYTIKITNGVTKLFVSDAVLR
jgi:muramoyltetrapeptide carboxypeptidase